MTNDENRPGHWTARKADSVIRANRAGNQALRHRVAVGVNFRASCAATEGSRVGHHVSVQCGVVDDVGDVGRDVAKNRVASLQGACAIHSRQR